MFLPEPDLGELGVGRSAGDVQARGDLSSGDLEAGIGLEEHIPKRRDAVLVTDRQDHFGLVVVTQLPFRSGREEMAL